MFYISQIYPTNMHISLHIPCINVYNKYIYKIHQHHLKEMNISLSDIMKWWFENDIHEKNNSPEDLNKPTVDYLPAFKCMSVVFIACCAATKWPKKSIINAIKFVFVLPLLLFFLFIIPFWSFPPVWSLLENLLRGGQNES